MENNEVDFYSPNRLSLSYDQYFKLLKLISQVKELGSEVDIVYKDDIIQIQFLLNSNDYTRTFNFYINKQHDLFDDDSFNIKGDLEELEELVNLAIKNKAKITEMLKHLSSKYSDRDISLLYFGMSIEKQEKNFWGVEL